MAWGTTRFSTRSLRKVVVMAGIVFSVSSLVAASPVPPPTVHSSGIEILPPIAHDAPLLPAAERQAAREAIAVMHESPNAYGWPFVDRSTGELVLSVAGPSADAAARSWSPRDQAASRVPRRIRTVAFSMAALEAIADDVTRVVRQRGLADSALIYQWGPDVGSNKVALAVDRLSAPLMAGLAARYDKRAIAVRVEPNPGWHSVSRNSDSAPFWGGALISKYPGGNYGCSDAFSMNIPSGYGMLTAGHCWPTQSTPGSVSTPVASMGTVNSGETNYNATIGTVLLPGQGVKRGDIALIRVTNPSGVQGYMYTQGVNSSTYAPVKETWGWASIDDLLCTGGTSTGEQCGWRVYALRQRQNDGANVVEPLTVASRSWQYTCLQSGDSGGPAYTVRPDLGIAAKGVLSLAGGCDWLQTRTVAFTEIQDALAALPGASVKTVP